MSSIDNKFSRGTKTQSHDVGPAFHSADADFQRQLRSNFPTQPVFGLDHGHENLESGNRLSRDVHGTTAYDQSYAYDGLHRLPQTDQGNWNGSTITGKNFEEDYALDQLGNWENLTRTDGTSTTLDQDRTHNAANETGTIDVWQNPAHDAAGNMTTIPQPKAPANGYTATYDAWNRLIKLNSGTDVQVNEYDGLHRRIVRNETGGSGDNRHFYYNEKWQCMEERVEVAGTIDPDPIKQYVYFPFYIDAIASVLYDPDTDGANIVRYDYLHDANFNVVAIVTGTTSFDVVERYHYSPYGEVTILNGASDLNDMGGDWSVDADQVSDIGNEFLYTGRRLDPETGLHQFRHRYYHAQMGRWMTPDPIGYLGGMNIYEYVGGVPIRYVDPMGLEPEIIEGCDQLGRCYTESHEETQNGDSTTVCYSWKPRGNRTIQEFGHQGYTFCYSYKTWCEDGLAKFKGDGTVDSSNITGTVDRFAVLVAGQDWRIDVDFDITALPCPPNSTGTKLKNEITFTPKFSIGIVVGAGGFSFPVWTADFVHKDPRHNLPSYTLTVVVDCCKKCPEPNAKGSPTSPPASPGPPVNIDPSLPPPGSLPPDPPGAGFPIYR